MTDNLIAISSDAPPPAAAAGQLNLPAAGFPEVAADIAAAPAVRWLRALMGWAETGRPMAEFGRLRPADLTEVAALLGLGAAARKEQGLLAGIAVRWGTEAALLRLRTGQLHTAKRHLPLLSDPAALWLRLLTALDQPDTSFTRLLAEHSDNVYRSYSPGRDVADLTVAVVEAGALDEAGLAAWYEQHWILGDADAGAPTSVRPVRTLLLLAHALGLLAQDEKGRWAATGLGRVCAALTRLPGAELDDDPDDEASLIATPDSLAEPGFVLRVNLRRTGVWRRLRLPGQLTAYGLHDIIQAAFGWDGDHLHKLRAGPFTFAPAWPVLDDAIPSEMVTLTDLSTLGVRELTYTYDLGDCWQHEIIIEAMLPPGDVFEPECLAGRGITPAEDGGDWSEDDDGNLVPAAEPEPQRVYDAARINRALARIDNEPDESGSE